MKKTIKVACIVLMIVVAVLLVTVYDGASPKESVTNLLTGITDQNSRAISDYYSGDTADFKGNKIVKSFAVGYDSFNIRQKKTLKTFTAKLSDFDYKVENQKINGKTATVAVKFSTYNFDDAMNNIIVKYRKQAVEDSLAGTTINDGELTEALVSAVKSETDRLKVKNKVTTVELDLTRVRGKWKINELSKKQMDAVYGGLATSITAINKTDKNGSEE